MPLFATRMLIIGGCASALFLAGALAAQAQTVCCKCHPPNDPSTASCLTVQASKLNAADDCVPLPNNVGLANGWTCEKTPLSATQCKAVSAGGVCKTAPVDAYSMVGEAVAGSTAAPAQPKPATAILPQLNTKIPGLVLNAGDGESSSLLAQYISGVYRYAVSIVAIVSAIMFIYGAFLYLVSGATSQQIQKGKDIMLDAVVGLILVLSATAILRTINPTRINLSKLNVTAIQTIELELIPTEILKSLQKTANQSSPQFVPSTPISHKENKFEDDTKIETGSGPVSIPDGGVPVPDVPNPHKNSMNILLPYVVAQAKAYGVHPCWVIVTISQESEWRVGVLGHDENFNYPGILTRARVAFLRSGVKKSKATFSSKLPPDCTKGKVSDDVRQACYDEAAKPIFNDDKLINEPPDFGVDWRFSHGFGLGQATLFPGTRCPNGTRGITYHGRCFTPPELVTVSGGVDATIRELLGAGAGMNVLNVRPELVFRNYIGGSTGDHPVVIRTKAFRNCVNSGKY